ncbi:uncharacterized protein N7511_011433 [Penicillium nucicola]|uniref:uncharacterized protein n=1 Tax=Penicillium nucicola TaxID=1850975 RepID=UPI002545198A|nr:uncharacterized protein N7511_011433 [Penicillium nucicola]KAJ5742414.1 hypothetical protein N7511_011433 [Penicillium nucicola]
MDAHSSSRSPSVDPEPRRIPVAFLSWPIPFRRSIPREMAYSEARLRQVELLFNGGVSRFSVLPVQYNLRERGTKRPEILASWLDDSNDEDYNPDKHRDRKKRKGPVSRSGGTSSPMVRKSQSLTFLSHTDEFNDLGSPLDPSSYHSEPEQDPDIWDHRWTVDPTTSPNSRYQLRPRTQAQSESPTKTKAERRIVAGAAISKFASSSVAQNTNEPLRGCKACSEINQNCSLATDPDPFAYPCTECEEDGFDCMVIPEPRWKRSCEKCRSRHGPPCSYRFADYDHGVACHSCLNHGYPCVAGPAKYVPTTRMFEAFEDSDVDNPSTQDADDSDDDDDSLGEAALENTKSSKPHELSAFQSTTISDISYRNNDTFNDDDEELANTISREENLAPRPNSYDEADEHPATFGRVRRIQTEFAHPLHFPNDRDTPNVGPDCHWCHNFAYGIVGLGIRNPEVIDFGTKMIEIADGHTGEGKEETRMCMQCAVGRIKIIQCTHGIIHHLPAADAEQNALEDITEWENFVQACDAIVDPQTNASGPAFSTNRQWCTLCRTLAVWACETPQSRRKVSPEPRTSPGPRARRHGRSEPPSRSRHPASSSRSSSSPSPPRYVPAHLQFQSEAVTGGRSPTPATATAGLSLSSEHSDMPSDTREETPLNTDGRSPSPGEKRPASEITDSDPEGGVSTNLSSNARTSGDQAGAGDKSAASTASHPDTDASPANQQSGSQSLESDKPTIDEQVAEVNALRNQPLKNGQKGYVVSMGWLKKVLARTTAFADQVDKDSQEAELGPIDNMDIVLDTDPATPSFKDESDETFVPMRPGLQADQDFVVVPQQAWDLMRGWYGVVDQSPIIVRYAHSTNSPGEDETIEYETNPPIFTIFKLTNPSAGTTPATLKEKDLPSVKILASRQSNYRKWLTDAKEQAGIEMSTKVRVWKILRFPQSTNGSTATTPAVSRSTSPAPAFALVPSKTDKLLMDLNVFLGLSEGSQRELLEQAKDQTNNMNYNGRMNLVVAGLGNADCLVLEEQISGTRGGEWVSEASAKTLKNLGIPVNQPKTLTIKIAENSPPASTASGRSTPAGRTPIKGFNARGRKGRSNRVLGLENLGNTCYQNSALQCLRAVEELTYYYLSGAYKGELNLGNPLGYKGAIAKGWATLLDQLYNSEGERFANPKRFRHTIGRFYEPFAGWEQQDSQEFVMFILDALSEDTNRIAKKPYTEIPDSTDEMVHNRKALEEFALRSWDIYKSRNDSIITDLFAGMYKSSVCCPDCQKTSIIFDPFSTLTLPIPGPPAVITRKVTFIPLDSHPVCLSVQLEASLSLRGWKEYVGKWMGVDPGQIVAGEAHHGSFWQLFLEDEVSFGSLRTKIDDQILFADVGPIDEEGILLPIFHRKNTSRNAKNNFRDLFGLPSFIHLSQAESHNLEAIYRKILRSAANMTTRDILNEDEASKEDQVTDDSDTVVTTEDDAHSADSKIKTSSVEGEDSLVDISMQDAQTPKSGNDTEDSASDSDSTDLPEHPLAGKISRELLSLFETKILITKSPLPDGRNLGQIRNKELPLIFSRIPTTEGLKKGSDSASHVSAEDNIDDYSDTDGSDAETAKEESILRQGDGIVLDWTNEGFNALFGGNQRDNEVRGQPSYNNLKVLTDSEAIAKRQQQVKAKAAGVTLDQCLDEFSKEEILSKGDAWYCPRCKKHLKRFTQARSFRSKLDTLVKFPLENLDLNGRVEGPADGKSLEYDLFAIDNHLGGLGGGHYTAYIKDFLSGEWNHCNDTHVRPVTQLSSMISSNAYLLFYRRRSARPLGNEELQELVESYKSPSADAGDSSDSQSPSGDGLGASSRNGSSSVLAAAGVTPQAGNGGLRASNVGTEENDDDEYSTDDDSDTGFENGESEGMTLTNNEDESDHEDEGVPPQDPFSIFKEPSWSFDQLTEAHDMPQMTPLNASHEDDGLFNDNDSTVAVGDEMDVDTRLHDLEDSISAGPTPKTGASFEDVSNLMEDESSDELPVVELRVGDEDKMISE